MLHTRGTRSACAACGENKKHSLRQAHSAHKRTYSCRKLHPPNRAKALPNPRARGESIEPGTAFSKRGKDLPPRAHARKRVLPIRPSASCLWGISCVPEARPLQDVNSVSMIHLATLLPLGFPKGPAGPFWPCGRRVGIGGGFSVPFWRQKGTCNASRPAGAGSSGQARSQNQISQAARYRPLKRKSPQLYQAAQAPVGGRPAAKSSPSYTSRLAYWAFVSINLRRGSTWSPIRMVKASSAFSASSMVICTITRLSGFMVVSHNWSGFISPRPL